MRKRMRNGKTLGLFLQAVVTDRGGCDQCFLKVSGFKRMPHEKQLQYLRNYQWSSLPGFIAKAEKLDFVEYEQVLAEYGGDNRTGRMRYKKQLADSAKIISMNFIILSKINSYGSH